MGSRNAYSNTLADAAPLTRESVERGLSELFTLRVPRDKPERAEVVPERAGWRVRFYGAVRFYERRARDIPRFVPLEGRLALRLMKVVGGGLTQQQIAVCEAVADMPECQTARPATR